MLSCLPKLFKSLLGAESARSEGLRQDTDTSKWKAQVSLPAGMYWQLDANSIQDKTGLMDTLTVGVFIP